MPSHFFGIARLRTLRLHIHMKSPDDGIRVINSKRPNICHCLNLTRSSTWSATDVDTTRVVDLQNFDLTVSHCQTKLFNSALDGVPAG